MRPSDFRWRLPRAAVAAVGLAWALAQPANGHVISIIRGSAVVHRDRAKVELEVNPEDFTHFYGIRAGLGNSASRDVTQRAADRYAQGLLQQFIIRDSDGERVAGRLESMRMAAPGDLPAQRFVYFLEYALKTAPGYLSFQQRIGDGDARLPSQLYLVVRAEGSEDAKTLRLTSGGNVETLGFQWPEQGSPGARPGIIGPVEELKSVSARLEVRDDGVQLHVDIPLPLMETFVPQHRDQQDFLETGEQEAAQRGIRRFLEGRFPLRINGGPVEPSKMAIAFVELDSPELKRAGPAQRLSVWTTRVRAKLSYPSPLQVRELELDWTLFNAAVLEVQAVVSCDGRESTRQISTYEPKLHWVHTP
jgi:hypothetical protein